MNYPLNMLYLKLFCFSSDFDKTWWYCNTLVNENFPKFHWIQMKNKNVLYSIHLTDSSFAKGQVNSAQVFEQSGFARLNMYICIVYIYVKFLLLFIYQEYWVQKFLMQKLCYLICCRLDLEKNLFPIHCMHG